MWYVQNDRHGVWVGGLTAAEMTSSRYGLWTIGDEDDMSPGFTQKLRYKTWYADPAKYRAPGHHVIPRAHGGRYKFVKVMWKCLECHHGNSVDPLQYPPDARLNRDYIELPPTLERTWVLPANVDFARGITLYRFIEDVQQPGAGPGYEFYSFDVLPGDIPDCLSQPRSLNSWSYQYTEVFAGQLDFQATMASVPRYQLFIGDHLFRPASQDRCQWHHPVTSPRSRLRGVTIFY